MGMLCCWRPSLQALVLAGTEFAALSNLERMSPPLARCAGKQDLGRLARLLLGDEANVSGVTLVAEAQTAL